MKTDSEVPFSFFNVIFVVLNLLLSSIIMNFKIPYILPRKTAFLIIVHFNYNLLEMKEPQIHLNTSFKINKGQQDTVYFLVYIFIFQHIPREVTLMTFFFLLF